MLLLLLWIIAALVFNTFLFGLLLCCLCVFRLDYPIQSMGQGSRNLGSRCCLSVWPNGVNVFPVYISSRRCWFLLFSARSAFVLPLLLLLVLLPLLSFSLHTHRLTGRRTGSAQNGMRTRAARNTLARTGLHAKQTQKGDSICKITGNIWIIK